MPMLKHSPARIVLAGFAVVPIALDGATHGLPRHEAHVAQQKLEVLHAVRHAEAIEDELGDSGGL